MICNSQRLTLGLTYNPAGQIAGNSRSNDAYALAAAGATRTHDARGNLVSDGRTYADSL